MKRAVLKAALAAALVALAQPAFAQKATPPADLAKAKMLYDVGAQAFEAANYVAAIKAFSEAYRIAQRPGLIFSIAQAHRKLYYLTKEPENLREALKYYREYASKVQQGGRRADVAEALAELEPLAARLDPTTTATTAAPATAALMETRAQTQLMVSTQTKGAKVSLDGAEPTEMPLIRDVKPGPHKLKVTAEGHFDYEREVTVSEGSVVPFDVALREKPALLTIETDAGADIAVNGRAVATTPLIKPIELPPGRHFIAITKGGHKAVTQDIEVTRGQKKTIPFRLETTGQRIVSYTLLVGGGVSVLAGVLLGLGAGSQEGVADEILRRKAAGNLTEDDIPNYNNAIRQRDEMRGAAVASLGTGVTLGAVGLLLYLFDTPKPFIPPGRLDDTQDKPSSPAPGELKMEVGGAPMLGPDFAGGMLIGRF